MAIDAAAGGGEKRQRVDGKGDPSESVGADSIPADRISALPDELRQRILTHLPLKDAVRTGAVARGWRDLWRCRWAHRSSVELNLRSRDAPRIELDALECEPRPRRRLDRLSLVVDTCKLKSSELRSFTDYAAECRVEDLHIEMRKRTLEGKVNFHLPLASPLLARLSLRRIGVSNMYYKGAQPFRALEVILLHAVAITFRTFRNMMSLCPRLLTLDLRGCNFEWDFFWRMVWPASLRSITFAECDGGSTRLDLLPVRSMRSFRFSGSFLDTPFFLPGDAVLSDLYIRFSYSVSRSRYAKEFNKALPNDLSALTVLTICNNALPVASSSYDDGETAQLPKLSNLHGLRELHLLMLKMEATNLADIYVFLKTCKCRNLERLFVRLPGFVYKSMESSLDVVPELEEPPEVGLDNLVTIKVTNFNWCCTEVQLVSFFLRKAKSMQKLLIVSPNITPVDVPGVQEADLLFLKEALANGKIMLSESDDAATQPYHSEAFIEV
ncbi:unnamed protein product [Urochloa humidicola]